MDVRFLTATGVERHDARDIDALLRRDDGFLWVDLPEWDAQAERLLSDVFRFHPMAVRACQERNYIPLTYIYADHVFLILHSPLRGEAGHIHLLELDQFISDTYLVTVHGPRNPTVPAEAALRETRSALTRIDSGRFHPSSPADLSRSIVSAIGRRLIELVGAIATDAAQLERRVRAGKLNDPEPLLEELFVLRQELQVVLTVAAQAREVYAYLAAAGRLGTSENRAHAQELADQLSLVQRAGDSERQFLLGVIDLYQTRVSTKMTVAAERLAVLAALTLPVTAISSVYGMNVIVNTHTLPRELTIVLVVMIAISGILLRWTKRQGWW